VAEMKPAAADASPVRNISDTALWAAVYRGRETQRPGGLFRDPFARRLAGARGEQIAAAFRKHDRSEWAWVMRTVLFDSFITESIDRGADMVVSLAAGLDARPYRMPLPPSLRWVEVDLPELLDYKEKTLAGEKPACALERVALDLADVGGRRALFQRLGASARKVLILTEGLLIYLTAAEVGALAEDLARPESFRLWALDVVSPGLLRMLQREVGKALERAAAPLKFGPEEGPGFFEPHGWRPAVVRSVLQAAVQARRVPLWMRLVAKLPESTGRQGRRPWSGICLLKKESAPP
jgi:methyltransferase (TIGR00027 family)